MRKIAHPVEYPENITALTHYAWAQKIFKECSINKLRIGIGKDFYPYHFVDKYGKLQGYEIELCEMMKEYFGVEIEYKQHSKGVTGLFTSLICNKVDLIVSSLSINAERRKLINFTVPYFENHLGVAVNEKYKNVHSLYELNRQNIKIALTLGSTAESPALRNFYRANIIKCATTSDLEQRLLEEKVDVIIDDDNWIKFLQRRHPDKIYILKNEHLDTSELISIGVAKDKQLLIIAISIFLLQYNDSAVRARIYKEWFGEAEAG